MYIAFKKRQAVNEAREIRNAQITAVMSNPNLDDGKDTKKRMLTEIEENFQSTTNDIYNGISEEDYDEALMADPFFAAMDLSDPV